MKKPIGIIFFLFFFLQSCSEEKYKDNIEIFNKKLSTNPMIRVYIDNSSTMKDFVDDKINDGCEHDKRGTFSPYKKLLCDSITRALHKSWDLSIINEDNKNKDKNDKDDEDNKDKNDKNDKDSSAQNTINKNIIKESLEKNIVFYDFNQKEKTKKEYLKESFYENNDSTRNKNTSSILKSYIKEINQNKNKVKAIETLNKEIDEKLLVIITDFKRDLDLDELGVNLAELNKDGKDIGVFCLRDMKAKNHNNRGKLFYVLIIGNSIDINTFSKNLKDKGLNITDIKENTGKFDDTELNGYIYTISNLFSTELPIIKNFEYSLDGKEKVKFNRDKNKSFMDINPFPLQAVEIEVDSSNKIINFDAELLYNRLDFTPFAYKIDDLKKENKSDDLSWYEIKSDTSILKYNLITTLFDKKDYPQNVVVIDKFSFTKDTIKISGKINLDVIPKSMESNYLHKISISSKIKISKNEAVPKFIMNWTDDDIEFANKLLSDLVNRDKYKPVVSDLYLYIRSK